MKDWKPENYGKKFYGPSTLRKGIEYSRNLMTVRIAKNLGVNKILDLSRELEIYDEIPELLSVSRVQLKHPYLIYLQHMQPL